MLILFSTFYASRSIILAWWHNLCKWGVLSKAWNFIPVLQILSLRSWEETKYERKPEVSNVKQVHDTKIIDKIHT